MKATPIGVWLFKEEEIMQHKKHSSKRKYKKRKIYKPFIVEWKAEAGKPSEMFVADWTMFQRYSTRQIALNAIAGQLLKSNLFLFRLKGEDNVYYRGC